MFPLIKLSKGEYQINGHFYGLRFDPDAKISCSSIFTASVSYKSGKIDKAEYKTFREAFNFLINKAVRPYFKY